MFLCDSFFQLIIGMWLHTSSETQEKNIQELLSLLPKTSPYYSSPLAHIVAFDRGYVKGSVIITFYRKAVQKYNSMRHSWIWSSFCCAVGHQSIH